MSPSSQPSSEDGALWLAEAVRARKPLLWTGHGASFALAQAFSEVTAQLGCPSRALPVAECNGEAVCLVSQPAYDPGLPTELLVTGVEEKPDWTSAPRIIIPGVMEEPQPWLPLPFMRGAMVAIRASLGLPAWTCPAYDSLSNKRGLVIVTRMAGPLRTITEVARRLIEELKLSVVSCDEFGYGMHAQLFVKPRTPDFMMMDCSGDGREVWDPIRYWIKQKHMSYRLESVSSTPGVRPLDALEKGLAIIEGLCDSGKIDWRTRRIPLSADWLQAYPPPRRVEGPSGVRKE